MANNPYANKVEFAGQTVMDLTGDTVQPSSVLNGVTFHDRSGAPQTGSMITHNVYDGLDSTSTSDALSANQGKVLKDILSTAVICDDTANMRILDWPVVGSLTNLNEAKDNTQYLIQLTSDHYSEIQNLPDTSVADGYNWYLITYKTIKYNNAVSKIQYFYNNDLSVIYRRQYESNTWYSWSKISNHVTITTAETEVSITIQKGAMDSVVLNGSGKPICYKIKSVQSWGNAMLDMHLNSSNSAVLTIYNLPNSSSTYFKGVAEVTYMTVT